MDVINQCLLLFFVAPKGLAVIAESTCITTDESNLKCQFPENVNKTQKDFQLYFYPDEGGEELLVECMWMGSQFYCIRQKGFELRGPVSDTAVITIPTSFSNIKGSYRCISDGYTLDSILPCQFPEGQDSKYLSTCEAKPELNTHQVMLKCVFSSSIESFSVIYNKSLVTQYTQSSCQSSITCQSFLEDNNHVFSVRLNMSEHPHSEYLCLPEKASFKFEVNGCSIEASRPPSLAMILPICLILLLSTASVLLLLIRRKVFWVHMPRFLAPDKCGNLMRYSK